MSDSDYNSTTSTAGTALQPAARAVPRDAPMRAASKRAAPAASPSAPRDQYSVPALPFVEYPATFQPIQGEFTRLLLQAHGDATALSTNRQLDFSSGDMTSFHG